MEIEYGQLQKAIAVVFGSHGLETARAEALAKELADATFAGYESHGIGRVESYLLALKDGTLRADAHLKVVRETPAMALLDADQGFGVLMALEAAGIVAAKARQLGIGAVSLRNCGDVARLAPYAERIALDGSIGIVVANDAGSGLVVAPHGGTQALLSTNPIAAGIPRRTGKPIVFDFATSQIAVGAARAATRRHATVPEDTLIGADGDSVVDPEAVFSGLAALLPLGGLVFGFKGTALGLLVEVLAGGLSGDGFSGDFPDRRGRNAVFMLAIHPEAFGDPERFAASFETFLGRLRGNRPRPGVSVVRVPGEQRDRPERIQILDALWEELMGLNNGGKY
jgi:hydroxycarboxylate dehydrogenase B